MFRRLNENQLTGPIRREVTDTSSLKVVDVSGNDLYETIPTEKDLLNTFLCTTSDSMEEVEGVESRRSRKEQERERRRLRDRERRQSMSQDERERHLARRRKNYQLRRQRAEISRIDSQIQAITGGGNQSAMTSPPDSGASSNVPLVESDQSVGIQVEDLAKLMGTIRLSRMKHLARTLRKSSFTGAEASNSGATYAKTRRAMSSGLRLSRVKRLVRSKGQQEGLLSQHSQSQGLQLH